MVCKDYTSARGFSLIEAATVLGVIAVLAALAYSGVSGLRARAASGNGIREIVSLLRRARTESFTRGMPVVFFMHPLSGGGSEYGALVDVNSNFDPAHIDSSIESTDVLLARAPMPAGVFLRASASPALAAPLPAPFAAVPSSTPCTFCDNPGQAVIVFRTDGTVALGVNPATHLTGGSFALVGLDPKSGATADDGTAIEHQTIAVLPATGTIAAFDR
jgi:prepilin-type N-terminal cleavage/methylation domain-containing protein